MAQSIMLVCDTCGTPAVETVMFRTSAGNRQRDYCAKHLQELLQGSRVPKRGRKPGSTNTSKKTTARTTRKKATRAPRRRTAVKK